MNREEDALFGKIAVVNKLIGPDQVKAALAQVAADEFTSLGAALYEQGLISEKQFTAVVDVMRRHLGREPETARSLGQPGSGAPSAAPVMEEDAVPADAPEVEAPD